MGTVCVAEVPDHRREHPTEEATSVNQDGLKGQPCAAVGWERCREMPD